MGVFWCLRKTVVDGTTYPALYRMPWEQQCCHCTGGDQLPGHASTGGWTGTSCTPPPTDSGRGCRTWPWTSTWVHLTSTLFADSWVYQHQASTEKDNVILVEFCHKTFAMLLDNLSLQSWFAKDLRTFLQTLLLCVVTFLGWDKGIFGICTFHIIPFVHSFHQATISFSI